MIEASCICTLIPSLVTNTKLCLIIHKREIKKPTNTGALASKCLSGSEVHICGLEESPLDYKNLIEGDYENLFLFPSHHSKPLTTELKKTFEKPVKLFVADGNWGQAKRIYNRFQRLNELKTVHIPVGEPTQYHLRREHGRAEGLATMEAIARSFGILENVETQLALEKVFLEMVNRTLVSRGTSSQEL